MPGAQQPQRGGHGDELETSRVTGSPVRAAVSRAAGRARAPEPAQTGRRGLDKPKGKQTKTLPGLSGSAGLRLRETGHNRRAAGEQPAHRPPTARQGQSPQPRWDVSTLSLSRQRPRGEGAPGCLMTGARARPPRGRKSSRTPAGPPGTRPDGCSGASPARPACCPHSCRRAALLTGGQRGPVRVSPTRGQERGNSQRTPQGQLF